MVQLDLDCVYHIKTFSPLAQLIDDDIFVAMALNYEIIKGGKGTKKVISLKQF